MYRQHASWRQWQPLQARLEQGQDVPGPRPATDFDARRVRHGWVTGYLTLAQDHSAGVRWDLVTGKVDVFDQIQCSNDVSPHGWIVGMDRGDDAVLTDGAAILKLPNIFPKPADYGMNWGPIKSRYFGGGSIDRRAVDVVTTSPRTRPKGSCQ